jgi:hypothetical protein
MKDEYAKSVISRWISSGISICVIYHSSSDVSHFYTEICTVQNWVVTRHNAAFKWRTEPGRVVMNPILSCRGYSASALLLPSPTLVHVTRRTPRSVPLDVCQIANLVPSPFTHCGVSSALGHFTKPKILRGDVCFQFNASHLEATSFYLCFLLSKVFLGNAIT